MSYKKTIQHQFQCELSYLGLHGDRLSYWTNQYEHEKGVLLNQYEIEMENYKNRKFKAHKELECVFYALQNENDTQTDQDEIEHLQKIDEVKSKVNKQLHHYQCLMFNCMLFFFFFCLQMILKLQEVTKDREAKMNGLWSDFQAMLKKYSETTSEKYAEYVELRDRDNADTNEIHRHYLEIARATRDLSLLKSILETQTHEHQLHMKQLNDYQKLLMEKQKKLKNAIGTSEKMNKKRLKTLVICSTEVNTVS